MAQANRKPTVTTEEVNLSEVKVKLLIDGFVAPMFGSKQKPKNGTLIVTFTKCGFELNATVNKQGGGDTKWNFCVKKLPSEIDVSKSSWKVEKGLVVVTLVKASETSWVPMLRRGLEQEESDSEEEK